MHPILLVATARAIFDLTCCTTGFPCPQYQLALIAPSGIQYLLICVGANASQVLIVSGLVILLCLIKMQAFESQIHWSQTLFLLCCTCVCITICELHRSLFTFEWQ